MPDPRSWIRRTDGQIHRPVHDQELKSQTRSLAIFLSPDDLRRIFGKTIGLSDAPKAPKGSIGRAVGKGRPLYLTASPTLGAHARAMRARADPPGSGRSFGVVDITVLQCLLIMIRATELE